MRVKVPPLPMSPYVLTAFLISLGLGTTITFASSH